ncbi:PAS domain-containing protein [Methylorubrum suomiense]
MLCSSSWFNAIGYGVASRLIGGKAITSGNRPCGALRGSGRGLPEQDANLGYDTEIKSRARERSAVIWVTDHLGSLTYVGQQWHHLTGQETSTALGMGWHDSLHPDDRAFIVDSFAEACQRQTEFMLLFRLQRTDGSHVWVLGGASPPSRPSPKSSLVFSACSASTERMLKA